MMILRGKTFIYCSCKKGRWTRHSGFLLARPSAVSWQSILSRSNRFWQPIKGFWNQHRASIPV